MTLLQLFALALAILLLGSALWLIHEYTNAPEDDE